MQEHGKSRDRREARLAVKREADAHLITKAIDQERLDIANAPILADITRLKAELANPAFDPYSDPEWEREREEEMGFQTQDDLYEASLDRAFMDDHHDDEFEDELLMRILFA